MAAKKSSSHCGLNWAKLGTMPKEPSKRECYDPMGNSITLKAKDEKASGGEGIVYTVPGKPDVLVKVYKCDTLENPAKEQAIRTRIESMCTNDVCRGMNGLAWPLMPVYGSAAAQKKKLIGFAMHACKGVPFASLFAGPASVTAKFPSWNRRQLAQTALNFVRRVRELAQANVFVNDYNPANFWVDEQCNVSFIDTDSFQVADKKGRAMITHTYFASHAAPELLFNPSALNRPRTIEQVAFSTALVAFQLLMCGYHPYSYQGVQGNSGCGSPDENLRAGRCPLGIGAGCRLPDAWYRLWSYLTGGLKSAFIQTFRDGHGNPAARATLDTLEYELTGLLITMGKDADPDRVSLKPSKPKPRRPPMPRPAQPPQYPAQQYPAQGFSYPAPAWPQRRNVPQQPYAPTPHFQPSAPQKRRPPKPYAGTARGFMPTRPYAPGGGNVRFNPGQY